MDKKEKKKKTYYANEVCNMFEVTKKTLFKWENEKKISKVDRDWRQWRVYKDENLKEIKKVIEEKKKNFGKNRK